MPNILTLLGWISLTLAGLCALIVAIDVAGHRQHMWIMNVVWIVTALYSGPLGLWAYFRWGRLSTHQAMMEAKCTRACPERSGQKSHGISRAARQSIIAWGVPRGRERWGLG